MPFKVIETTKDLPQVRCITVNIFAENKVEAHAYANRFPERNIYWIEDESMGVWVTPVRRESDKYGK